MNLEQRRIEMKLPEGLLELQAPLERRREAAAEAGSRRGSGGRRAQERKKRSRNVEPAFRPAVQRC